MNLPIEATGTEQVTTSVLISDALGIEHRQIIRLIRKYQSEFNRLGAVRSKVVKCESKAGGRPWQADCLNESHVMFLFSLMENNEKNIATAVRFIDNFKAAKKCLNNFIDALRTFDFGGFDVRYVYAAVDTLGRVKIGISNDPERRLKELNTGNADTLNLVFVKRAKGRRYLDETTMHASVKEHRIRSEWFTPEAACKLGFADIHGKTLIPGQPKQITGGKDDN